MFGVLLEVVGELIAGFLWRLLPLPHLPPGPVERPELPPGIAESIVAALKAGQDATAVLPPGWRGFTVGLANQAEPEVVARVPIGADLQVAIEPDETNARDRIRVNDLGYLPPDKELERSLLRGWLRCWLADRRPTARYADGAAILFVAVYDPR